MSNIFIYELVFIFPNVIYCNIPEISLRCFFLVYSTVGNVLSNVVSGVMLRCNVERVEVRSYQLDLRLDFFLMHLILMNRTVILTMY